MAGYASKLRGDIARWVDLGLIDQVTASALLADAQAHERRALSFGGILMIMAGLLFAAALLLLVAANWEAFPRLMRVATLFATILVGYVGGAVLKNRDHGAMGEAAWLIAAAAFGGSIALIGQMYHLSGDEGTAILTWCAGTALAAIALRSGPLTIASVGIAVAWMFTEGFDLWDVTRFPYAYVAIAGLLWLVSYWTRSVAARHLLLLSLIVWAMFLAMQIDTTMVAIPLAAASILLFVASVAAPAEVDRIVRLDGRLPLHALIGFLVAIALIEIDMIDEHAVIVLLALIAFGGIAAALVFAGRESRGLRWVAYAGFCFQLCFVYVVTVGTMIGTAGLFLLSGVALAAVAFLIIRIEKRLRPGPDAQAGAV